MTKKEAIERFNGIINAMSISIAQSKFYPSKAELNELCDMAIEALSAEAEQRWIPCSEMLPKTGDSILVTYSDGEVDIVWSARPEAWVTYIESNNLIYPIAWMPLPKPYREDGEA